MAILNDLEGSAHVQLERDGVNWSGYILLDPDIANLRYFDIAGPLSRVVYEGPVLVDSAYYFANEKVQIVEVSWPESPKKLKVAFRGIETLNRVRVMQARPSDYPP